MNHSTTVAVLGLGAMGHAFARNLLEAGFTLQVWNRSPEKGEDLGRDGARVCDTPAAAAANAEVLITMVPDLESVRSVLFGDDGALAHLPQHAVLAQMGTIGVEETDALIDQVAQARSDVVFVDSPVAGTKAPAEKAEIVVLASGDRERAGAVEPVFEAIGRQTKWLGAAGRGARMKITVNAWLVATMQGIAETAVLAQRLGFSADDLWNTLDGGPLANPYIQNKLAMIQAQDFTPQMALTWGLKDAELALEAAGESGMPALAKSAEVWRRACEQGHGDQDIAVVHAVLTADQADED